LDGIPDEDSSATVFQAYAGSYQINAPAGAVGAWNFDVYFFPHPYMLGAVYSYDTASAHTAWTPIVNLQIGSAPGTAYTAFNSLCEQYRMAYYGVTGYHDSSATANQGICAVTQYSATPATLTLSWDAATTINLCEGWVDQTRTMASLQNQPSAYLGNARDGFYAPMKLTNSFKTWVNTRDVRGQINANAFAAGVFDSTFTDGRLSLPVVASQNYPYAQVYGTWWDTPNTKYMLCHQRMDHNQIQASVRNLDLTASYTFYIRMGMEMHVLPGTILTPQQKLSPALDEMALDSYWAISRDMKDAYPADFNDLGTIIYQIASIAADVIPAIYGGIKYLWNSSHPDTKAAVTAPSNNRMVNASSGGTINGWGDPGANYAPMPSRNMTRYDAAYAVPKPQQVTVRVVSQKSSSSKVVSKGKSKKKKTQKKK
jgi:hypothetical protein